MVDTLTYLLTLSPNDQGSRKPGTDAALRDSVVLEDATNILSKLNARVVCKFKNLNSLLLGNTVEELSNLYDITVRRKGEKYEFEGVPKYPDHLLAATRGYSLSLMPNNAILKE